MSGHGTMLHFRRAVGDHHILADRRPHLGLRPGPRHAQRSAGTQTAHQLALVRTASLNVEGLVCGLVRDAHEFVIREVNLQPVDNLFRRLAMDPFAITPMWLVPTLEWRLQRCSNLAAITSRTLPSKRSCTQRRRRELVASFDGFGLLALSSAFHCATEFRYPSLPPRVAALRVNSRETIGGLRSICRAISRTPMPWAEGSPISPRSANDKYLPETGLNIKSGMPPR